MKRPDFFAGAGFSLPSVKQDPEKVNACTVRKRLKKVNWYLLDRKVKVLMSREAWRLTQCRGTCNL